MISYVFLHYLMKLGFTLVGKYQLLLLLLLYSICYISTYQFINIIIIYISYSLKYNNLIIIIDIDTFF
eukprot:UN03770